MIELMRSLAMTPAPNAVSAKKRLASGLRQAPFGFNSARLPETQRHSHCACGGGCPRCKKRRSTETQANVSRTDDPYERKADRMASEVMRGSVGPTMPPATKAPPTASSLAGLDEGRPLPDEVRRFFEPRFDFDFSHVRVHTGRAAHRAAQAVSARAFTLGGRDVVLGSGETVASNELLAHELTHVVQQVSAPELQRRVLRTPVIVDCDSGESANILAAEFDAEWWLDHALSLLRNPNQIAAELAFHFHALPTDARTLDMIRVELRAALHELEGDTISYRCAPAGDPDCEGNAGFSPYLGSLEADFCGTLALGDIDPLVPVLIHEVMHAKIPGIPDGPYRSDPDYPGSFPLNNADAYTAFVADVAKGFILGVSPVPVDESLGLLAGDYESSLTALDLTTDLRGFPVDGATLSAGARDNLDEFLDDWAANLPGETVTLRLAGHTDGGSTRERGAELGRLRAQAVADYLLDRLRTRSIMPPVDVVIVSYGRSRPFTLSGTPRGQALNRRVQIQVRRYSPGRS
jgi:outer membrane protein OmpA-like peptidoglycan-associated protein